MKDILVIVANASRARVYCVHGGTLERLESLTHPESRQKDTELVSDRPGRTHNESGGGGPHRSGMAPETDPHDVESDRFAREVARRACIVARRGRYTELLLVAPARFLGRVKARLDDEIAKRVVATVSHDYTAQTDADLVDILQGLGVHVALPSPA